MKKFIDMFDKIFISLLLFVGTIVFMGTVVFADETTKAQGQFVSELNIQENLNSQEKKESINSNESQFLEHINEVTSVLEEEATSQGDEVVKKLVAFKKAVESSAYQDTILLCEGYRRVTFKGSLEKGGHRHGAVSSLLAWNAFTTHGLSQPFTAMGGLKSEYLFSANVSLFKWESWFDSLYVTYLVQSSGFSNGVKDCFGADSDKEIQTFVKTLFSVDNSMSLLTHGVLFFVGSEVISLFISGTRFLWKPVANVIGRANKASKGKVATTAKVTGVLAGTIGIGYLIKSWKRNKNLKSDLLEKLNSDSDSRKESRRRVRAILIANAFELYSASFKHKEAGRSNEASESYAVYREYVLVRFTEKELKLMENDREEIENKIKNWFVKVKTTQVDLFREGAIHSSESFGSGDSQIHINDFDKDYLNFLNIFLPHIKKTIKSN